MFIHSITLVGRKFVGRVADWRRRTRCCKELMMLSDYQLTDLPMPEYQPTKWFWRA